MPSEYHFFLSQSACFAVAATQENRVANKTSLPSRRLIGRRFDDPTVKKDVESWPFAVIEGGKGEPLVQVEYLGETKTFTPPQISAMVLGKVCLLPLFAQWRH